MKNAHTILLLRKRTGLSQGELAELIGISQSALSRIEEAQVSDLRLDAALSLTVIFGQRPHRMFAERFAELEDAIMTRAADLYQALRGKRDAKSMKKHALLDDMMRRATASRRKI